MISEHLEREKKIKQEVNRIKKIYRNLEKDKVKVLEGLIKDAAFMKVTLEEFRETLIQKGTTKLFKQGKQELEVERHESKMYLPYIQKYSQVMKQLIDLFPPEVQKTEEDALTEFVKRRKGR
ncbi:hypothetical protein [uncultured Clostridium sp.]|uniref:hypothetical protein n=1 Tax=uncultured Clostridium sp. TaxID=59620 RepID=UPI00261033F5|nr:hypothetical protein [uncultured Clostridium sp.]